MKSFQGVSGFLFNRVVLAIFFKWDMLLFPSSPRFISIAISINPSFLLCAFSCGLVLGMAVRSENAA